MIASAIDSGIHICATRKQQAVEVLQGRFDVAAGRGEQLRLSAGLFHSPPVGEQILRLGSSRSVGGDGDPRFDYVHIDRKLVLPADRHLEKKKPASPPACLDGKSPIYSFRMTAVTLPMMVARSV